MTRPTISGREYDYWTDEVPAPPDTYWAFDPAATSDRIRLFATQGGRVGFGEIGTVYPNGTWWVYSAGQYQPVSEGICPSSVPDAMREMLEHARALGWKLELAGDVVLRPEVLAFARRMELKLRKHDGDRGPRGWAGDCAFDLITRLEEELMELHTAATAQTYEGGPAEDVINEAVDVANFAMMIADVAVAKKDGGR